MKKLTLIALATVVNPFNFCEAMMKGSGEVDLSARGPRNNVSLSTLPAGELRDVHTLNLAGRRDITDADLKALSQRDDAARLANIDLGGTGVTGVGLHELLYSEKVGTKRDLPQISARYDLPSAELYINVQGCTSISDDEKQGLSKDPIGPFNIEYRTSKTSEGIKWMHFKQ